MVGVYLLFGHSSTELWNRNNANSSGSLLTSMDSWSKTEEGRNDGERFTSEDVGELLRIRTGVKGESGLRPA